MVSSRDKTRVHTCEGSRKRNKYDDIFKDDTDGYDKSYRIYKDTFHFLHFRLHNNIELP